MIVASPGSIGDSRPSLWFLSIFLRSYRKRKDSYKATKRQEPLLPIVPLEGQRWHLDDVDAHQIQVVGHDLGTRAATNHQGRAEEYQVFEKSNL